jgi:hypothetical protein
MIELMRATAKEILHNSRLTNDDIDSLCMGKFRIIDNPKGFDYGIRYYIKSIFTLLGGSQDSILRFCTYDEFEHIHRKIYNPSNPIFRYFLIDNEYERRQFCNNYTQDYKGYLTLFQTIGHPLEKLFFFVDRCKSTLFNYS